MKTLCLDFGNSQKKIAVLNANKDLEYMQYGQEETLCQVTEEVIKEYKPTHSIYSTVIAKNLELEKVLKSHTTYYFLDRTLKFNFTIPISTKDVIGADRLALLEGAVSRFPNNNTLIVCLDTCITFNFLNVYNQFLGGSISPGLGMRFSMLKEKTFLLPKIDFEENIPLTGFNTKTNILSGVIWGLVKEIQGIIREYQKRYLDLHIIFTGGDCHKIGPLLNETNILTDDNFLLKGLYAIIQNQ